MEVYIESMLKLVITLGHVIFAFTVVRRKSPVILEIKRKLTLIKIRSEKRRHYSPLLHSFFISLVSHLTLSPEIFKRINRHWLSWVVRTGVSLSVVVVGSRGDCILKFYLNFKLKSSSNSYVLCFGYKLELRVGRSIRLLVFYIFRLKFQDVFDRNWIEMNRINAGEGDRIGYRSDHFHFHNWNRQTYSE